MLHKREKKRLHDAIPISLKEEMAKPRIAKSARIAARNLDATRVPPLPSSNLPGRVDKIIPTSSVNRQEKAQIHIDDADLGYRDLRIENTLIDEDGDDVSLKKGAHVEVTVTSKNAG